jgi:cytoskeletal protein CcmA (bactofilin family)
VTSGNLQDLVVASGITSDTLTSNSISGVSGEFQNISGNTITGTTINAGIVNVHTLNAVEIQFSGDQQISGDLTVLQNFYVLSGAYINGPLITTGLISGETITGQSGTFDTIVTAPTFSGGFATFTGLVVSNNGNIGGNLNVTGTVTSRNNLIVLSGQAKFPWGTEAAPGITFTGDLNTGFYNPSGEMITATVNGSRGWTIESGTGDSEGRHVLTIWGV